MKKYLILPLAFLLFSALGAKAQTNQSAPTTEDALNFITKVSKQLPYRTSEHGDPDAMATDTGFVKIEVKECKLYLYYWTSWFRTGRGVDVVYRRKTTMECLVIDLANARISNQGLNSIIIDGNNEGAIKNPYIMKFYTQSATQTPPDSSYLNTTISELNQYIETNQYVGIPFHSVNGTSEDEGDLLTSAHQVEKILSVDLLFYLDRTAPNFRDNNYAVRLRKAYEVIIKNCGGGKMKVDSSDKF